MRGDKMNPILLPIFWSMTSSEDVIPQYGPITPHFDDWLERRGYGRFDFSRLDLNNSGSFGGVTARDFRYYDATKLPIIFFHGNSDAALHANDFSTGWTITVEHFLNQGYSLAQLYGTSWGDTNTTAAVYRDHDCKTVYRLRKFVEAVLDYTGAPEVNIISHSMGVTLARKVIQGGYIEQVSGGICNIGKPLGSKIRAFLGIAGANYGLCACVGHFLGTVWPTCNDDDGLWPGETCGRNQAGFCATDPLPSPCNSLTYSKFLMDLNSARVKPAKNIFSMWSKEDELIDLRRATRDDLIGDGNMVWGRPTSEIPFSDGNIIYENFTHMQTKENTAADQFFIITNLRTP